MALFGFAAQAQEQPTEGAKINSQKVINYGKSKKVRMELVYSNLKTSDGGLNSVRASCGCTTPSGRVNQSLQEQRKHQVKYDTNRRQFPQDCDRKF